MIKAVILDFNGTLYLDHDLNDYAWGKAFDSVKDNNSNMTFKEFFDRNIETLTKDYDFSKGILETFNKDSGLDKVIALSKYKEDTYIAEAKRQNRKELMKGAEKFLEYLKENNIKYCIASMAPKMNFDFYLEYLNLKKWFSFDNIVYDCSLYENKNDQYIEAIKRMNVNIDECLLIEDSPKVILRALDIGIKNIIYLNTKNKEFKLKEIIKEAKDFDEIDLEIFKK